MDIKSKAYKLVPIIETIMKSKEDNVLGLFFNNPTREWHFEEILKQAKITRSKAAGWLKVFLKQGIIKKAKENGKMPFYIGNYESAAYKNRKKLFALNELYNSGLLNHLASLPAADTVVLFGSFSRSDWYEKSDIDIFIYGDYSGLKMAGFEQKLHRDIEIFNCKDKGELKKFGEGLLSNIIKGNLIKGDMNFVRASINA
ncbi:MAG: nucleotidyltransferase domain-containing protein [Candidatus Nanoarchaeia archaeon]|nr:nucleotidyltransferase domain-containing protein [Candidatus Nanoarchaeia archaeon]